MTVDANAPVLVVEAHEGTVRILRSLLEQLGYADVDAACDGREALSKMKARRYGLVISEAAMEPMTGRELLASVRGDDALKTTPFLIMTAEARSGAVLSKDAPCIAKPFNARALQQKIETLQAA